MTLQNVADSAAVLLRTDLSLATSMERLRSSIDERELGGPPTTERLRQELERHPDQFRVLVPTGGPWRAFDHAVQEGALDGRTLAAWATPSPVVVPVPETNRRESNRPPATNCWSNSDPGRLRRSVCWLGTTLDARSIREIARWVLLAQGCALLESRSRTRKSEGA